MIILNNVKFAETKDEMISSLFNSDSTCSGYAERLVNKIELRNLQKKLIGVINQNGVLCKATKLDNGKYWYTFADIDLIGEYDQLKQTEELQSLRVFTGYDGKWYYKSV